MFKRLTSLLLLGGICFPPSVTAQESSGSWKDFACIRESDPWLGGYNASGLVRLPVAIPNTSFVEAYAQKEKGDFVNYYQSNNSFAFGAQTESFFRINAKVVVYGKMDYLNFTGQNMGGSVFLDPYATPFNMVEVNPNNTGEKSKEHYHLTGAVGVRITPRFSIGGKIDYLAANYTKHKDLRHENIFLDLTASPGFAFQWDFLDLGANYLYRRNVESVKFGRYGTTDILYSTLIDFGALYGRTELWGESGYTSQKTPIFNQYQGAALQINLHIGTNWGFFNEFSYLLRNGRFGNRSTSNNLIEYSVHDGSEVAYSGVLSFAQNQNQHLLNLNFCLDQLSNFENMYRRETLPDGGGWDYIYYGSTQILDRTRMTASVGYTGRLQIEDYCPVWELKAGGNFTNHQLTNTLYPFYRKQDLNFWNAYIKANKRITVRKNQYGIALGVLYGGGGGDMNKDGLYATPSEDTRVPYSSDFNVQREYEYLTANRVGANIGGSFSRMITPKVKGYVRLAYEFTHALEVEYLPGNQFHSLRLAVGCGF